MTKILNFGLKIKGAGREGGKCEVLRPCHPPKFGTCIFISGHKNFLFFTPLTTKKKRILMLTLKQADV